MKLWMIGAGPGEPSLISAYALEVMRGAQVVLATERLYEAFQPILENVRLVSLTEMETFLADNPEDVSRVAVLASGDVGFYSISRIIRQCRYSAYHIRIYPHDGCRRTDTGN